MLNYNNFWKSEGNTKIVPEEMNGVLIFKLISKNFKVLEDNYRSSRVKVNHP